MLSWKRTFATHKHFIIIYLQCLDFIVKFHMRKFYCIVHIVWPNHNDASALESLLTWRLKVIYIMQSNLHHDTRLSAAMQFIQFARIKYSQRKGSLQNNSRLLCLYWKILCNLLTLTTKGSLWPCNLTSYFVRQKHLATIFPIVRTIDTFL